MKKQKITYTEEEVLYILYKFDNMKLRPERKLDFVDIKSWFNQNKKK